VTECQSIKLPDCLKDVYAFERILKMQDRIGAAGSIDLSGTTFIEPYSMASLLIIGRNHLRETGNKLVLTKIPMPVHQYLSRMDFFSHGVFVDEKPLSAKNALKRSAFSRKVMELMPIPNKERESVKAINNAVTLFRLRGPQILKFFMAERTADMMVTALSELWQNVFEHSLDSGFFTAQAYEYEKSHVVRLVIADSGIGVDGSFEAKKCDVSERGAELLQKVVLMPVSSKRPYGFGLCQVHSIMNRLGGNLFIRSGSSSAVFIAHGARTGTFLKNGLAPFAGTQISLTLSSEK
jgi:anti-sigma regulatory factor (Ser/Thr protein kinase)